MIIDEVPGEQALALKELGFDEICSKIIVEDSPEIFSNEVLEGIRNSDFKGKYLACPTFSQGFRWFREKYNIYVNIDYDWNDEVFRVEIMKHNEDKSCNIIYLKEGDYIKNYKTPEDAELECLKKLIEIVKIKTN